MIFFIGCLFLYKTSTKLLVKKLQQRRVREWLCILCAGKSFKCKCVCVCLCFSLSLDCNVSGVSFLQQQCPLYDWGFPSTHLAMSIAGCNSLGWIPHVLTMELIFVCYYSFAPPRICHFTLQRRITKCIILHKWKRASWSGAAAGSVIFTLTPWQGHMSWVLITCAASRVWMET